LTIFNTERSESATGLVRPFLRWAGGKQKIIKFLLPLVPEAQSFGTYFEPFFGAGSMFFACQPKLAVLSDVNEDLMHCYRQVANNPSAIGRLLSDYREKNTPEFFYKVRRSLNAKADSKAARAAKFIYLNKAAFNGIYRVNCKGEFNVPYGPSANGPALPTVEQLKVASGVLRGAQIKCGDFEHVLKDAKRGDFVYLDPPYPPRSETAYFTHYSASRFDWEQQERLARVVDTLSKRGCLIMLSNVGQKSILKLYSEYYVARLNVVRWLGSNGDRFRVREVVVTNYRIQTSQRQRQDAK